MNFWYSQNLLAWCLLPLSWLYCLLAGLRRSLYRRRWLPARKPDCPVIIVGNISVGGTGKTPLIIALCEWLQQQRLRPGIVSRGYGGRIRGPHAVCADDRAEDTGDEPLLLHQRTGCPVVIGADRAAAADYLAQHHACDVILSDDGLQHYALQRDVEIAVIDASRLHGNGFCLPAGPLREPVSRLNQVDLQVWHSPHGETQTGAAFHLQLCRVANLASGETAPLERFAGQRVHALAGIGHPARFFNSLRQAGIEPIEHAFADHHAYQSEDCRFDDDLPVLMTEKDAVKCRDFAHPGCWVVAVEARLNPALQQAFRQLLARAGLPL